MISRTLRCQWPVSMAMAFALAVAGCGWAEWPAESFPRRTSGTTVTGTAATPVPLAERPARITVQRGDSVERLSRRYGAPARSIIELNSLTPPYRLYVGQTLALPRDREHAVRSGETLSGVAADYKIDLLVLAAANGLTRPYVLRSGQRLRIPEASAAIPSSADLAAEPVPTRRRADTATVTTEPIANPSIVTSPASPERKTRVAADPPSQKPPSPVAIGAPPPKSGGGFVWPVTGEVISRFGSEGNGLRNDGINIAAAPGAPVRAAETGVVAYAGNELKAFGNLVLIKHAGGWVTTYAHNSKVNVARGDVVKKGQIIAEVGSSGRVTTPQLHFEMRKGREAVDPLRHLPPGRV